MQIIVQTLKTKVVSAEHYIKSQCPSCGEFIEFPEHGLGETIECPHCKEQIELKRTSLLNSEKSIKGQMNVNQKILTVIALLAFLVSVCIAPWEQISISTNYEDHRILAKTTVYSPVWEQPNKAPEDWPYNRRYEYRLLWSPLLGVWIGIGVLFTGSFFLLKNTPSILDIVNKKR